MPLLCLTIIVASFTSVLEGERSLPLLLGPEPLSTLTACSCVHVIESACLQPIYTWLFSIRVPSLFWILKNYNESPNGNVGISQKHRIEKSRNLGQLLSEGYWSRWGYYKSWQLRNTTTVSHIQYISTFSLSVPVCCAGQEHREISCPVSLFRLSHHH